MKKRSEYIPLFYIRLYRLFKDNANQDFVLDIHYAVRLMANCYRIKKGDHERYIKEMMKFGLIKSKARWKDSITLEQSDIDKILDSPNLLCQYVGFY